MRPTRLDPRKPYKPLDVGNGIVSGSVTPGGLWLSLGFTHPVHGRVELTDAPAFPDASRGDQPAARRYRADLASPSRKGFGLHILRGDAEAFLVEDSLPLAVHEISHARVEALTLAPRGRPGAIQIIRLAARDQDTGISPNWRGSMRLARAAYTQLTPGGRLAAAPERTTFGQDGQMIWIDDRDLGAAAAIALPPHSQVPAGTSVPIVVAIALALTLDEAVREAMLLAGEGHELVGEEVRERRTWWQGVGRDAESDRAIRRATAYALDCAAARAGDGVVAMLADHEILPLVWTRDAYYVCRMLLESRATRRARPRGRRRIPALAVRAGGAPGRVVAAGIARERRVEGSRVPARPAGLSPPAPRRSRAAHGRRVPARSVHAHPR